MVIRKYPNRRLYDTEHSCYVNLKQIAEFVKQGEKVEVTDSATGEDITKVVLTQIIMEEEKGQKNLLPTEFLHQIIQDGEAAFGEFTEKFVSAGLEAYKTAQQHMETAFSGWLRPWTEHGGAGAQSEIERLKSRIAELEGRLAARSASKPERGESSRRKKA